MAFEELLNQPATESSLLKQLVAEIQANYTKYQTECFFFKLEKAEMMHSTATVFSQIAWVKKISNKNKLVDFFYNSINERACILLNFEVGRYDLFIQGFQTCDRFKIWPNRITDSRPIQMSGTIETQQMHSRELLENAFGEIDSKLNTINSSVPI
jgi:hypothetical protein